MNNIGKKTEMGIAIKYAKHIRSLLIIQLALSAFGLSILCWFSSTQLNLRTFFSLEYDLYPWTIPFFNPIDSTLRNYIVTCLLLASLASMTYFVRSRRLSEIYAVLRNLFAQLQIWLMIGSIIGSVCLLISIVYFNVALPPKYLVAESAAVAFLPWFLFLLSFLKENVFQKKIVALLLFTISFLLLLPIAFEQFMLAKGPIYLMNEYPDIYGETIIKGERIDNKLFLKNLTELAAQSDEDQAQPWLFDFHSADSVSAGRYKELLLNIKIKDRYKLIESQKTEIDAVKIKRFYLANFIESIHQNSGRGQMNHIGHILNPINEYELGKSLSDIYIQYGLGNTFLMKWTMDLFGGNSIQNYYKTYLYYTIYYLSFLIMLIYVFRNNLYVLLAFAVVPASFWSMGYIAYIIAPGIVPSIHLLDASTAAFFVLFLRGRRLIHLGIAVLLSLTSIVISTQFGIGLSIALLIALLLFCVENTRKAALFRYMVVIFVVLFVSLFLFQISRTEITGQIFPYFFAGLFSWPAHPFVIIVTLVYLVASYFFLILLRSQRTDLKYLYVFVFAYSQYSLVYYFWSGLLNHLPPMFPFVWFQICLMFYIGKTILWPERPQLCQTVNFIVIATLALLCLVLLPILGLKFYGEKNRFQKNFEMHRTYNWDFKKATVISTLNQRTVQEAVELITRYSEPGRANVYLLSKYDNLLPFLSNRYNSVPFFDLVSYLFSKKEYSQVVNKIKSDRPKYLLVDTNIDHYSDLWNVFNKYNPIETSCRLERYSLLKQIFNEVKNDYEKVEHGQLLTAYKRRKK